MSFGQFAASIWYLVGPLLILLSSTSSTDSESNIKSTGRGIDAGVLVTGRPYSIWIS